MNIIAKKIKELRKGDYINTHQGEGYIVAELPTGDYVISMKKTDREGRRVNLGEINKVWRDGHWEEFKKEEYIEASIVLELVKTAKELISGAPVVWSQEYIMRAEQEYKRHTKGEPVEIYIPDNTSLEHYVITTELGAYRLANIYRTPSWESVVKSPNLGGWAWKNSKRG